MVRLHTPPTASEQAGIGFEDIRIVLEDIAARELPEHHAVMTVDSGKLKANRLSDNVQMLLTAGMSKAPLVKQFFLTRGTNHLRRANGQVIP